MVENKHNMFAYYAHNEYELMIKNYKQTKHIMNKKYKC